MSLDEKLRAWAEEERSAPAPSRERTAALISAAEQRAPRRPWLLPVLALAALALLLVYAARSPAPAPEAPPLAEAPAQPPPPVEAPAPSPYLAEGAQDLGADRVTVGEGARVRLLDAAPAHTLLSLEAGALEAQVSPRAPGQSFVVRAAEHEVRVVGTRFSVRADPLRVEVQEGVVEVIGAQTWRLEAGDRFEGGALIRAARTPSPSPPPALSELRAQVLAGELDPARAGLQQRLSQDTTEVAAWKLLAQLERKAGDPAAAVAAWRAVIRVGPEAEAQRARFEAARLLEGQPAEAEALLRDFLRSPDPLAPEARLRLAEALLAQRRGAEAEAELERLISEHPGDPAASRARSTLQQIRTQGETSEGAEGMER
ncbi:MAG: tetratricopeptide repeat protein [Alphaproteobacteria bacterium]|nr:tetratricopeptide repeat protein [Alphaproteobacteria bacterium]MCB9792575.1 tetratricopeptide repeat protein [Alphaproteobacteria bacterium]